VHCPLYLNRPAIRLGGSPFKTIAKAEKRLRDLPNAPNQMRRPDNRRSLYLLAPRYAVHTALAKVWDAFRAHAFSTSATIDDILILGCVWPLAAAT